MTLLALGVLILSVAEILLGCSTYVARGHWPGRILYKGPEEKYQDVYSTRRLHASPPVSCNGLESKSLRSVLRCNIDCDTSDGVDTAVVASRTGYLFLGHDPFSDPAS
jgi:hypothetical protein